MVISTGALAATGLPAGPAVLAGPESDKAGPLGLLTIVVLGIAVYFLYRSMVRHIKKVPASFDQPTEQGRGGPAASGARSATGAAAGSAAAGPPTESGAPPGSAGASSPERPAERQTRPPVEP